MLIKYQKINLNEIYNCCVKQPFSQNICVAVMGFAKAMSTLGMTEMVRKGLMMC